MVVACAYAYVKKEITNKIIFCICFFGRRLNSYESKVYICIYFTQMQTKLLLGIILFLSRAYFIRSISCQEGYYVSGCRANLCSVDYCVNCPSGYYNNIDNRRYCTKCPEGYYGNKNGLGACKECPEGYYQVNIESTSCTACDAGTYQNGLGKINCKDCSKG